MNRRQATSRFALATTILIASACAAGKPPTRAAKERAFVIPGCTIFAAAWGDTALFGNNEDWNLPTTFYWVRLPGEGTYGGVYTGHRSEEALQARGVGDIGAQGGVNEMGLAYDFAALPRAALNAKPDLPAAGTLMTTIQERCATVEEAIALAQEYDWGSGLAWQVLLADATGDAVVMSAGADGELAFTRKPAGDGHLVTTNWNRANPENTWDADTYPCVRYNTVLAKLEGIEREEDLTLALFRSALEETHIEGAIGNTEYSTVIDLKQGLFHLYLWHQYEEVATIDVAHEIAKHVLLAEGNEMAGLRSTPTRIRDLFSSETVGRAEDEHQKYKLEQSADGR